MKKRLFCLALALLFLAGCAPSGGSDAAVSADPLLSVYRLTAEDDRIGGDLLQAESCALPAGGDTDIPTALALFASNPADEALLCALPAGVTVDDWSARGNDITLVFSDSLLSLDDITRTVTVFAAVLTLCALESVSTVTVRAGDTLLYQGLTADDALLQDTNADPYTRRLRLYFADSDGRYLVSEVHTISVAEDVALERYVIEELLRGPNSADLQSRIPEGTTLRSISTEDGLCTVDLSAEFLVNKPDNALDERLAVYSIVNSLTVLSGVDSVLLLCGGQPLYHYVCLTLTEPVSRCESAIGPVRTARGETDADLYLLRPDRPGLTALPCAVPTTEDEPLAQSVLRALFAAEEAGWPALFAGLSEPLSVSVSDRICQVDLAEDFSASLSAADAEAAVQSMTATLCALSSVRQVYFTLAGEPLVVDGVDLSGPQTADELTILP